MGNWDVSKPNNDGERELLDRAVKALETEFATKTCNNKQVTSKLVASEDCISRRAVLDCLTATKLKKFDFILSAREEIKKLPSVVPKQKTGRWIYGEDNMGMGRDGWYCNQCGHFEFWDYSLDMKSAKLNLPNSCPNCLAKMQEVEE